jgi:hypothetical protein
VSAPDEIRRTHGLNITSETVLVEVPRARSGEALRVTHVRAKTPEGSDVAWVSLRLFFCNSRGALLPSKSGITVRMSEAAAVAAAIAKAASSAAPPTGHQTVAPRQEQVPGTRTARRQATTSFQAPPPPPDDGIDPDEIF